MRRPHPPVASAALLLAALALACGDAAPVGPSPLVAGRLVIDRSSAVGSGQEGARLSIRPDGSDERPLGPSRATTPSPDWSRVATAEYDPETNQYCLAVRGRDGALRSSGACGPHVHAPLWSPNGSRLLVRIDNALHVVRLMREQPVVVATLDAPGNGGLAWSPDGRRFAAVVGEVGGAGVGPGWLVHATADGGDVRTMANVIGTSPLAWSPDGAWIAARSQGATSADELRLYSPTAPLASRALVAPAVAQVLFDLQWSPDGSRLAFVGVAPEAPTEFPVGIVHRLEVFVVRVADGALSRASARPGTYDGLAWSPDGTQLAFSGTPGGTRHPEVTGDVFVVDVPAEPGAIATPVRVTTTADAGERVVAWVAAR